MKSLIEESSSIAKAIEKGWERAGKPQSFSVKVYELPEKNFLGMTTKYAKIGIFFSEEKIHTGNSHTASHKKDVSSSNVKNKKTEKTAPEFVAAEPKTDNRRPHPKTKQPVAPAPKEQKPKNDAPSSPVVKRESTVIWSDEMVHFITNWLDNSLAIMDLTSVNFTTTIANNHLKVHFEKPLVSNDKQAQLFRGLSYIIMASIRAKFKTDLKGLRVMFSCD